MGGEGSDDVAWASNYLLSSTRWAPQEDMFLDDFADKHKLPQLALLTKGQYLSIGAPNKACPLLKPYVLVHSQQTVRKCIASIVKLKDLNHKNHAPIRVHTDVHLTLPARLSAFFEILSEDCRPAKCLESVAELAKKFPEMCLVRQNLKAYLPDQDGELRSLYKTRAVHDGEVLTLVGQFNFKKVVFLRCFDEKGSSVYLKMTAKNCKFSPIAKGSTSITGVHTIANLMTKRLPLTVRMIQGKLPPEIIKAIPGGSNVSSSNSSVVFQLEAMQEEAVAMVYSLQREDQPGHMLAVPLNSHLKVSLANNAAQVRRTEAFAVLCRRCESLTDELLDRVTLITEEEYQAISQSDAFYTSSNSPQDRANHSISPPIDGRTTLKTVTSSDSGVNEPAHFLIDDDEIDQLYDYVRGLAPLPETCRAELQRQSRIPRHAEKIRKSISQRETLKENRQRRKSAEPYSGPIIRELSADEEDEANDDVNMRHKSSEKLNAHWQITSAKETPYSRRQRPFSMAVDAPVPTQPMPGTYLPHNHYMQHAYMPHRMYNSSANVHHQQADERTIQSRTSRTSGAPPRVAYHGVPIPRYAIVHATPHYASTMHLSAQHHPPYRM